MIPEQQESNSARSAACLRLAGDLLSRQGVAEEQTLLKSAIIIYNKSI